MTAAVCLGNSNLVLHRACAAGHVETGRIGSQIAEQA